MELPDQTDSPGEQSETTRNQGKRTRIQGARGTSEPKRRGGRRRHPEASNASRYFIGGPGDPNGQPTLEREVSSEPEGLIIAFKTDSRLYIIHEYQVSQRIEGNEVRLEKQPVSSAKRVSTANAS